jgi:hypothetical protein
MLSDGHELWWLFGGSDDARRAFVADAVVGSQRHRARAERVFGGPLIDPILECEGYDPEDGPYVMAVAFLSEGELERKRLTALRWCFALQDIGISSLVVSYTLNANKSDFATLEWIVPERLGSGLSTRTT